MRALRLRLAPVTVVVGANGTGKTNLYQASLHESVLPALADLMAAVPRETQLWVTTHAPVLADALATKGAKVVELEKVEGETRVVGARLVEPDDEDGA